MIPPEAKIKKEIRTWLAVNGIYYANVAGGAFSKPGDPDIIADVDGYFLAIEAKTKTGRQSEYQKTCQRQIEESGGTYIVARSLQDVIEVVTLLKTL